MPLACVRGHCACHRLGTPHDTTKRAKPSPQAPRLCHVCPWCMNCNTTCHPACPQVLDDIVVQWSDLAHRFGLQLVRWRAAEYFLVVPLDLSARRRPLVRIVADTLLTMAAEFRCGRRGEAGWRFGGASQSPDEECCCCQAGGFGVQSGSQGIPALTSAGKSWPRTRSLTWPWPPVWPLVVCSAPTIVGTSLWAAAARRTRRHSTCARWCVPGPWCHGPGWSREKRVRGVEGLRTYAPHCTI